MNQPINHISLLPWQSTIITWVGGATILLLIALIVMQCLPFKKKIGEEKFHTIFCWTFLIFLVALVLSVIAVISFLVDVELGWKLSVVAGTSILLFTVSIVAMLIGAFGNRSKKIFYLWVFLSMLSFVFLLNLVMIILGEK